MKTAALLLLTGLILVSCSRMNPVDENRQPESPGAFSPAIKLGKGLALSDVDSIIAIVKGDNIVDSLVFPMAFNNATGRFSGAVDVPENGNLWTVTIVLLDAQRRKIGQGGKALNRTTTSLAMDTISCTSALPVITAFKDTVMSVGGTIHLKATVNDNFNGTIRQYEWSIGSMAPFVTASGPETDFLASTVQDSLICVLRVTDNDGNIVQDTAVITVIDQVPPGMRYIHGGAFTMGYGSGLQQERPEHLVTLSPFFMDTVEVTQEKYASLMGVNPSLIKGSSLPVNYIDWYDAVLFCNARSKQASLDSVYRYESVTGTAGSGCELNGLVIDSGKTGYRLPTDAEWEYACRGGTTTLYFWGNDSLGFTPYAWSDIGVHPGALKQPNAFGLYDMIGNISEWCQDLFTTYSGEPSINPWGVLADDSSTRVMRGYYIEYVKIGIYWEETAPKWRLRSTIRTDPWAHAQDKFCGFRCVRSIR